METEFYKSEIATAQNSGCELPELMYQGAGLGLPPVPFKDETRMAQVAQPHH